MIHDLPEGQTQYDQAPDDGEALAVEFVTLEVKSHNGKSRLSETKRRLRWWDGKTWRVVQKRPCVAFSERPGPWLHVAPFTPENTGGLSRWVSASDDVDFTVTANANVTSAEPAGGAYSAEGATSTVVLGTQED